MKSRVHNPKYLEKYFTQFPNIIDDSSLNPYEYRLLIHYYRVGECWEGVRKTSEICKMSTGKVAASRKSLEEKGFITISDHRDGIIIHLVDLSKKNLEKYSGEGVHEVNSSVHAVNEGCSSGELKKNQFKKNHLRTSESEDSAIELFPEIGKSRNITIPKTKSDYPEYQKFIDIWCTTYKTIGVKMPRDGGKIKLIISETRNKVSEMGIEPTEENVIEFWNIFVTNLHRTWAHRRNLSVIDSHYRSLIDLLQNGETRFKQPASKTAQARDFIASLKARD